MTTCDYLQDLQCLRLSFAWGDFHPPRCAQNWLPTWRGSSEFRGRFDIFRLFRQRLRTWQINFFFDTLTASDTECSRVFVFYLSILPKKAAHEFPSNKSTAVSSALHVLTSSIQTLEVPACPKGNTTKAIKGWQSQDAQKQTCKGVSFHIEKAALVRFGSCSVLHIAETGTLCGSFRVPGDSKRCMKMLNLPVSSALKYVEGVVSGFKLFSPLGKLIWPFWWLTYPRAWAWFTAPPLHVLQNSSRKTERLCQCMKAPSRCLGFLPCNHCNFIDILLILW